MLTNIRKKFHLIIPEYAVFPLILALVVNGLAYFGTRPFTTGLLHHDLSNAIDERIPFITWFIYPYIFAYLQWIIGFVLIGRESKRFCYTYLGGEMIAKLLCLLCFCLYPTMLVRPEVTGSSLSAELTRVIYTMDAADNLFPSIHCLESYVCLRTAIGMKRVPRWYVPITFVCSCLVFASTVLVKQHVMIDIVGGVLVYEIGIAISKRIMKRVSYE